LQFGGIGALFGGSKPPRSDGTAVKTVLRQSNLKFRPEKTGIISVSFTLACSV